MDQSFAMLTLFDQLINTDQQQMLKALIPYLSSNVQPVAALGIKISELLQTINLFQTKKPQFHSCEFSSSDNLTAVDMINNIRNYCYGESRQKLDQLTTLLAMIEAFKIMNESANYGGSTDNE